MKKILSVIIIITMCISLFGCGNNAVATETATTEAPTAETATTETPTTEAATDETPTAEIAVTEAVAAEAAAEAAAAEEAAEKAAAEKAAAEKVAAEKAAAEKAVASNSAEDKAAAEKAAVEREAAEKVAVEKAAAEKAAAEKAAAEKAAAEKAAAEKAAAEKAAAEKPAEAKSEVVLGGELSIDGFVKALKENGFRLSKVAKMSDMVGSVDGYKYNVNGIGIEIYKFDLNSKLPIAVRNIKNIQESGKMILPLQTGDMEIPAEINNGLVIAGVEKHKDKDKILEIFMSLK